MQAACFSMKKIMVRVLNIVVALSLCFGVGLSARWFQASSIDTWYPMLVKPALTPPDVVFPIVWGVAYLCMGLSFGLILDKNPVLNFKSVVLFSFQLMLNFLWSILFFYLQNPLLGLIDIVLLDVFAIWYAVCVRHIKKISSWLFIPYIVWILFATYLNGCIFFFNR